MDEPTLPGTLAVTCYSDPQQLDALLNPTQNVTATFNGGYLDKTEDVKDHVLDRFDGEVWVAVHCDPGTDELQTLLADITAAPELMGLGICWARDDDGRLHYVVEATGVANVHVSTREEAWELAVTLSDKMESHYLEYDDDDRVDNFYPFDLAYDNRIAAFNYGNKVDLLARIPAN